MGLQEFKIVFDNPESTYYPGQTVKGNIVLVLDSVKKIRGISVKAKGMADTCWDYDTQQPISKSSVESTTVSAHEDYFETKYYLVGSAAGGEIELSSGEHKFPFTCTLPSNLPSSFESDYGSVRYIVKATLDRPWKFDQDVKAAFTVISPFDLNLESRATESIDQEMSKTFCCLCCSTAPLSVTFSAPVRGYVPGQKIPVHVVVDNASGVLIQQIQLLLCKVVTFHSSTPCVDTKVEELIISRTGKGPVEGRATSTFHMGLKIPPVPPSNLSNCGIIDVEYKLKAEACVTGWYRRNLSTSTIIFIGTIPLMNYETPSAPPESEMDGLSKQDEQDQSAGPSTPPRVPDNLSMSNLYPNLPPPSYEESSYNARTIRERGESENIFGLANRFAPRYPVYTFEDAS